MFHYVYIYSNPRNRHITSYIIRTELVYLCRDTSSNTKSNNTYICLFLVLYFGTFTTMKLHIFVRRLYPDGDESREMM